MDLTQMFLIGGAVLVVIAGVYIFFYMKDKKSILKREKTNVKDNDAALQLKLHAYERLVLFADRIALPNLISRVNQPGMNAREMQLLLTQTIRQEFEHNVTQQIYVTADAWSAVRNLKEQNMLIINQVASYLPETATGMDLNKSLMEVLMENPKASLHNVVSDVLSFEAKKLMD
jgi:hypothetical protein